MKSIHPFAFTALAVIALSLGLADVASATIPYGGLAPGIPGSLGPDLASPSMVPGKEYSHDNDQNTAGMGGGSDPDQVIAWDGSGGTADGLDYSGTRGPNDPQEGQVDATANRRDHLFNQVIGTDNVQDTAHLVFSHDDQISVYFGGGPPVMGGHSQFTLPFSAGPFNLANGKQIGGTGELSYEKATAFSSPSDQGIWARQNEINGMPNPDDVDGVEIWGPEPGFTADAEKYSLNFDATTGVSVWSLDLSNNSSTPYISHTQIVNAVTTLLGPMPNSAVLPYPTFIDGDARINLDALMVQDVIDDGEGPDTFDRDPAGDASDRIIFSIRQIVDPQDPDGYYATGSELFVLDQGDPNNPTFLFHGGHLWDKDYAVNNLQVNPSVEIDFAYAIIDINAIEAVSATVVPEPASVVLLLVGLIAVAGLRFRRS